MELIQRHESLRTLFRLVQNQPVQKVHEYSEVGFEIEYFGTGHRAQGIESAGTGIKQKEGSIGSAFCAPGHVLCSSTIRNFIRPFDLSKAPLLRVGLIKMEETPQLLTVDMHHIISDGTSVVLIAREFTALYAGRELPPLRFQYKDYVEWQQHEKTKMILKEQAAFWQKEFDEEISAIELPLDFTRPSIPTFEGSTINFELSARETRQLKALALEQSATLYMVLLTLYILLLSKLSRQEDIIIGTPAAGRRHTDLEPIIGMFVNTLPTRNYPAGEKTLKGILQEIKEKIPAVFENQDYPLENLADRFAVNRETGRHPLFDVVFAMQTMDIVELKSGELTLKPYELRTDTAKFDLALEVIAHKETLVFTFEYSTKLFKRETIERFICYFKTLAQCIAREPNVLNMKLKQIEIIPGEEKNQLLYDFNETAARYPKDKTIHQLFEEQVARTPDNIGLVGYSRKCSIPIYKPQSHPAERGPGWETVSVTYRELNEESDRFSYLLREKGVQPETIVGIMLERSLEMIIAILAILKSRAAYLPIDPGYPEESE
jgi:hypothetical protein